jgi:hypothetical protein
MTWAISSGVAISCSSNTAGAVAVMVSTSPAILLLPNGQSLRSAAPKSGMAEAFAAEAALGIGLVLFGGGAGLHPARASDAFRKFTDDRRRRH